LIRASFHFFHIRDLLSFRHGRATHSGFGILYSILDRLEQRLGGAKTLSDCSGRIPWPQRGVYFFFENSERRNDSGTGSRLVRVGAHALTSSSRTKLWARLSHCANSIERRVPPRHSGTANARDFVVLLHAIFYSSPHSAGLRARLFFGIKLVRHWSYELIAHDCAMHKYRLQTCALQYIAYP